MLPKQLRYSVEHRKKKCQIQSLYSLYLHHVCNHCTNTTISHRLNEGENKMHTFYNIM